MKFLFLSLFVLFVSSCGRFERWTASWTGYSELCVDGVVYLQFTSGSSVKYNPNGTIVTCQ